MIPLLSFHDRVYSTLCTLMAKESFSTTSGCSALLNRVTHPSALRDSAYLFMQVRRGAETCYASQL